MIQHLLFATCVALLSAISVGAQSATLEAAASTYEQQGTCFVRLHFSYQSPAPSSQPTLLVRACGSGSYSVYLGSVDWTQSSGAWEGVSELGPWFPELAGLCLDFVAFTPEFGVTGGGAGNSGGIIILPSC